MDNTASTAATTKIGMGSSSAATSAADEENLHMTMVRNHKLPGLSKGVDPILLVTDTACRHRAAGRVFKNRLLG